MNLQLSFHLAVSGYFSDSLLEQLSPVADDELEQAADLLANFRTHWERLEGNKEARHELIKLIVERVYVKDKQIVAMTLRSNYHLVLGHKTNDQPWLRLTHFYTEAGATGLDTALDIGVWSGYQRSNHTNSLSIQDFMAFFFPTAHEAIDWEKGYIFLDKDL